jgi:hypothetical protein
VVNRGGRARVGCREDGDVGIDSMLPDAIPPARRTKMVRLSSGPRHRSSGRSGTVVADGGHGGDLGRACREEEEGTREERKERGRERDGGTGSYPLQAGTAAASISSQGSTTAAV